jgi:formate hydrogenlyase transcriptional activator
LRHSRLDVSEDQDRRRPRRDDDALRAIVEGVEAETGAEFFASLVRHLSSALAVQYAFVSEITLDRLGFRTLALWGRGALLENVTVPLAGTPCEAVLHGETAHHPTDLQALFPRDTGLADWGAVSYCGVPLFDRAGVVTGHLAVIHDAPMPDAARIIAIMRIFAARVRVELERMRIEQALRDSEERFRDLYDEAPIAYVYEGTDSRFVSANRAATRLLGIRPEDVPGTLGLTFVAPTPENQERVRLVLEAVRRGEERASVEIELRRKDDGRPIWVQWWSKPDADGRHTRTMLVDVTDRVLLEQERNRLQQQNLYLREEIKSEHDFDEIIGASTALRAVLAKVAQVAPTDSTVLVLGETGTGKELIARAVHNASKRKDRPLIKLNCAALPTGLVESELFGHEKGAFTGATDKRIGRFELADGGTIFLDEVGELPLDVQVKLLRVLQEREFERVGGTKTIRVDVRVIAATNRDLADSVGAGNFRRDLYYRLNVFPVELPPLRERIEDVPLLVHYFVGRYAAKSGRTITRVPPEAMQRLTTYPWPGNVREVENVVERAVILSEGPDLSVAPELLRVVPTASVPVVVPGATAGATALEDVDRQHIVAVLKQTGWRIDGPRGAARLLNMHPSTLRSRMQKLGIRRSSAELS